jgi:hypothetical protein
VPHLPRPPHDLGRARWAAAGLATYSGSGPSQAAVAAVLAGRYHPVGRLPVSIPDPRGRTLFRFGAGLRYRPFTRRTASAHPRPAVAVPTIEGWVT